MIENKTIIAITLARGGSSRIHNKNIVTLCGKPLIAYTINEVKKSSYIDKYIVSTDDEEIAKICESLNVLVFKRCMELASSTARSSDALIEAVEHTKFDYVVEVMCTNPLKIVDDIDGCLMKLHETGCDSVVSVARIYDHHPSRIKYIENDMLYDFYPEVPESRRQDLSPPAYIRNGSIYAMTYSSLLSSGIRLGACTRPYIMPEKRTINIDEPIDLMVAEQLITRQKAGFR